MPYYTEIKINTYKKCLSQPYSRWTFWSGCAKSSDRRISVMRVVVFIMKYYFPHQWYTSRDTFGVYSPVLEVTAPAKLNINFLFSFFPTRSAFVQPMRNATQSHAPNKKPPRRKTHVGLALFLYQRLPESWQLGPKSNQVTSVIFSQLPFSIL